MEFSSVGCIIGAAADLGVGAPGPDRSVRGSVWPHLPMNTQDSVCGVRDRSGSENERGAVASHVPLLDQSVSISILFVLCSCA